MGLLYLISPNQVSVASKILSFKVFKVAMSVVSPGKEYHQDGEASSVVLVPRFLKSFRSVIFYTAESKIEPFFS